MYTIQLTNDEGFVIYLHIEQQTSTVNIHSMAMQAFKCCNPILTELPENVANIAILYHANQRILLYTNITHTQLSTFHKVFNLFKYRITVITGTYIERYYCSSNLDSLPLFEVNSRNCSFYLEQYCIDYRAIEFKSYKLIIKVVSKQLKLLHAFCRYLINTQKQLNTSHINQNIIENGDVAKVFKLFLEKGIRGTKQLPKQTINYSLHNDLKDMFLHYNESNPQVIDYWSNYDVHTWNGYLKGLRNFLKQWVDCKTHLIK